MSGLGENPVSELLIGARIPAARRWSVRGGRRMQRTGFLCGADGAYVLEDRVSARSFSFFSWVSGGPRAPGIRSATGVGLASLRDRITSATPRNADRRDGR
jgi:hypothetical protein